MVLRPPCRIFYMGIPIPGKDALYIKTAHGKHCMHHFFISRWRVFCQVHEIPLHWCHNERDEVSNHRCLDSLLNRLFRRRLKKTSKIRVTGLCERNLPVICEFPAKRASDAENVSILWSHHVITVIDNTDADWILNNPACYLLTYQFYSTGIVSCSGDSIVLS